MLPRLDFGVFALPSYAVFLTLGLVAAARVAVVQARRYGVDGGRMLRAGIAGIAAGLIGARLWSAVFEVGALDPSLTAFDAASAGGLSVIGGMLAGALGVAAFVRLVPPRGRALPIFDVIAPGAALALVFGRLGCLFSGCCHGEPTLFPIALVYESFDAGARPIGVPLHATPIYEAAGCLALTVALWRLPPVPVGMRLSVFLLSYGVLRAAIEALRGDWRGEIFGWPTTQLAAMAMAVAGALSLGWLARARRAAPPRTGSGPAREAPAAG